MRIRAAVLALALICAGSPALASDTSAGGSDQLVHPDPDVLYGQLPNGMRYAIKQWGANHKEMIDLYVAAGSADERDDERGVAHFLEHMAFNGSRHVPADTLIHSFQTAGIGFGRDLNATTEHFATNYTVDIPNLTPEKLDLSFQWLGDVADGLLISPDEVDRERGVVLSEYRDRSGTEADVFEGRLKFLMPGSRAAERTPIGDRHSIETASAETIRGFYRRWYRPENAILVAVGDVPVQAMKARIEAAFSGWTRDEPAPAPVSPGSVDFARPTAVRSIADPHGVTTVSICRYVPSPPHRVEDVSVDRPRLLDQLWTSVVNERFARRAREAQKPFAKAEAVFQEAYRAADETCLEAVADRDDWKSALMGLSEESRRFERWGVTRDEFDVAAHRILAETTDLIRSGASYQAMAESILYNMVVGDTFDTFEDQQRIFDLALHGMGPADAAARIRARWTDASPPLILVTGPQPPTEAAIAAAWREALSAPQATAPADTTTRPWGYASASTPGRVARRTEMKDPDFTRIVFANGVVLNFRRTSFNNDRIQVHVLFGAGNKELPKTSFSAAGLGGSQLWEGGLKRNDVEDLNRLCAGRLCGAELKVGPTDFDLSATTRPEDLELELQILTGFLTEPGFRPEMTAQMPTVAAGLYRQLRADPVELADLRMAELMTWPHRKILPSEASLAAVTANDLRRLLEPPLTKDALEVTIVGDVDEAAVSEAVARTLGALPPRAWTDHARPDAPRYHFAPVSPAPITVYHEGIKDEALVQITWPLFVWAPERVHESRVIGLVSRVLQDELIERIRQKLGKSYSPLVALDLPHSDAQGSLRLYVKTAPAYVETVRAEALNIARDLAAGRLSAEQLAEARGPWLSAIAHQRAATGWLVETLNGSVRHPDQLTSARGFEADIAGITLEEARAEAARWLARRPYIILGLPKPGS